jgi:hypothetical protein
MILNKFKVGRLVDLRTALRIVLVFIFDFNCHETMRGVVEDSASLADSSLPAILAFEAFSIHKDSDFIVLLEPGLDCAAF